MENNVALEQLSNLADQLKLQEQVVNINSTYDSFCRLIDGQLKVTTLQPRKRGILSAWERNKQNNELKCAYFNFQKEFTKVVHSSKSQFRTKRQLNFQNNRNINQKLELCQRVLVQPPSNCLHQSVHQVVKW